MLSQHPTPGAPTARVRYRKPSLPQLPAGEITVLPIDALSPYARNPRKHPEAQLVKLSRSIAEFGFLAPVLARRTGEIVAGEARVAAARRVGLTHIPTIYVDHLNPSQVRAYRLADNRLAESASWDFEILADELGSILSSDFSDVTILGWEAVEIQDLTTSDQSVKRARNKVKVASVSRPGDVWHLGTHQLICGVPTSGESKLRHLDALIRKWESASSAGAVHASTGRSFAETQSDRLIEDSTQCRIGSGDSAAGLTVAASDSVSDGGCDG